MVDSIKLDRSFFVYVHVFLFTLYQKGFNLGNRVRSLSLLNDNGQQTNSNATDDDRIHQDIMLYMNANYPLKLAKYLKERINQHIINEKRAKLEARNGNNFDLKKLIIILNEIFQILEQFKKPFKSVFNLAKRIIKKYSI